MSSPLDRPRLEVGHVAESLVVRVAGCDNVDEETIPFIREQLLDLADRPGPTRLLLDLGGVRFLSSSGLGLLVGLHKRLRAGGGSLAVCGVNPDVREVFEVTRLDQVLDLRTEG